MLTDLQKYFMYSMFLIWNRHVFNVYTAITVANVFL